MARRRWGFQKHAVFCACCPHAAWTRTGPASRPGHEGSSGADETEHLGLTFRVPVTAACVAFGGVAEIFLGSFLRGQNIIKCVCFVLLVLQEGDREDGSGGARAESKAPGAHRQRAKGDFALTGLPSNLVSVGSPLTLVPPRPHQCSVYC